MNSPIGIASSDALVDLRINGDLTQAGSNWADQELLYQYRVVVFESCRTDNTVTADFSVISPKYASTYENRPCVNCIYSKRLGVSFFIVNNARVAVEQILGANLNEKQRKSLSNKMGTFESTNPIKSSENLDDVLSLITRVQWLKPRNIQKGVRLYRWEILERLLVALAKFVVRVSPFL
jgi:hypothetical protein